MHAHIQIRGENPTEFEHNLQKTIVTALHSDLENYFRQNFLLWVITTFFKLTSLIEPYSIHIMSVCHPNTGLTGTRVK